MELYQNIKNRRIELNLSQSELASKVGYRDKGSISRIENGTLELTQSQIVKFAEALECTPAYLMGWETKTEKEEMIESIEKIKKLVENSEFLDLTQDEINLIETYRLLDSRGKQHILDKAMEELKYMRLEIYSRRISGSKE